MAQSQLNSEQSNFQVAIDGPVAAGKGTISRLVANRVGFLYVDTGAMYRMVAMLGIRNDISLDNQKRLLPLVKEAKMEMYNPREDEQDGRLTTVVLNGEDVSWKIRTEEIGEGASQVSVYPQIRKVLVKKQQKIAEAQNVIMEGRDITHTVLPKADLKVYLTADDVVRAKRRHFELLTKGTETTFEEVYQDLLKRDKRDKGRKTDPLKIVKDAWVIDTTDLAIEQVVNLITSKIEVMTKSR